MKNGMVEVYFCVLTTFIWLCLNIALNPFVKHYWLVLWNMDFMFP